MNFHAKIFLPTFRAKIKIFNHFFRAHLKLVWTFLLCSCIVSGLLFFKIRRLNKYEEKSLEFQTISNAEDDAIDLEQRLKRADLFYR